MLVGTRPEAIKLAPLAIKLRDHAHFELFLCLTQQHKELLDQALEVFDISPDVELNIMSSGQTLTELTSRLLSKIGDSLLEERPDLVVVQGDTTTSFAGALASFYQNIPVAHVEAGLRSNNRQSPWPEELNRRLTACLSNIHFAPTEKAKQNLIAENIPKNSIYCTGNTGIDALLSVSKKIDHNSEINKVFSRQYPYFQSNLKTVLVTVHRRENFGRTMENICRSIKLICELYENVQVVIPVHPNPTVKETVYKVLSGVNRVHLIDPVPYQDFVYLMKNSYLIMSDSGGIQEEAPSLGKPVLILRKETERPEAISHGTCILAGTEEKCIIDAFKDIFDSPARYQEMSVAQNPFGDGTSSELIVKILDGKFLNKEDEFGR